MSPCEYLPLPGGVAIVCSRMPQSKCVVCGKPSTRQCDYPLRGKKIGKTCSRHLCDGCTVKVDVLAEEPVDYCPGHAAPGPDPVPMGEPRLYVRASTLKRKLLPEDGLDITRKSSVEGLPFAPSWSILEPYLAARKSVQHLFMEVSARDGAEAARDACRATLDAAWAVYVPAYLAEMRVSYRREREAWEALLARQTVTLLCYCPNGEGAERCHRTILGRDILRKLGAAWLGEMRGRAK